MSKKYTQLTLAQRYQIESLIKAGINQQIIAKQLLVHPSTISRELKRNIALRGRTANEYVASNAERKTRLRHELKPKKIVLTTEMKRQIIPYLTIEKWSPEFISQALPDMASHETIYQWIWDCKHSNRQENIEYKNLYTHLKHGKRRQKRGNIKDNRGIISGRIPISERPKIVENRERIGDIEVDLMIGKDHQGALLVMTDRTTLHTRLKKLLSKEAKEVETAIISCLNNNQYKANTLTFDNDKAFSCHKNIKEILNIDTYFTRPYTSQDKGTVENRIGVIRRFFPKKTNLNFVTEKQVEEVELKINNRPVRKFNYNTPNIVLKQKIALIT